MENLALCKLWRCKVGGTKGLDITVYTIKKEKKMIKKNKK